MEIIRNRDMSGGVPYVLARLKTKKVEPEVIKVLRNEFNQNIQKTGDIKRHYPTSFVKSIYDKLGLKDDELFNELDKNHVDYVEI